jgi:hypothetical protein
MMPALLRGPRDVFVRAVFCGIVSRDLAVCTAVLRKDAVVPRVSGRGRGFSGGSAVSPQHRANL